jgi:hypothetical protein
MHSCLKDGISLDDLKRQIHAELRLLPNRFNLTIRAKINTTQPCQGPYFYTLFWMNFDKF